MENRFAIEVRTAPNAGFGDIDTIEELLKDVETEYGKDVRDEVEKWAEVSKENDTFIKYGMRIMNIGKK